MSHILKLQTSVLKISPKEGRILPFFFRSLERVRNLDKK